MGGAEKGEGSKGRGGDRVEESNSPDMVQYTIFLLSPSRSSTPTRRGGDA